MSSLPETEAQFRLECLHVASNTANPDHAVSVEEVIQRAETFFRYVMDGTAPAVVLKIAGGRGEKDARR